MMVLGVVLIMSLSCILYIYMLVFVYLYWWLLAESSLCMFTILFKIVCLAAVAYSATVNTVITIKM